MAPPIVLDSIVLEWRCHHRTHCCRTWRIDVPPPALREMVLCCTEAGDLAAGTRLLAQHQEEHRVDGVCALPMNPDGACMFLRGELCGYRIDHGTDTLPFACVKFPYLGLLTPKRRLFGLSFTCPTALELLARESELELREDCATTPPIEKLYDFAGDERPGQQRAAEAFWDTHWQWFELLRDQPGTAVERLAALATELSGLTLPTVDLDPVFWQTRTWDSALAQPLLQQGANAVVLEALVGDQRTRRKIDEPAVVVDEDDLLLRYVLHRLLVPEFLMSGASLARLVGVLFAVVARFRLERAQGASPLAAIAHLDRLVLHSDFVPRLFPEHVDEAAAWPSLALLALAR